jgi:hypothetical protein
MCIQLHGVDLVHAKQRLYPFLNVVVLQRVQFGGYERAAADMNSQSERGTMQIKAV